MDLRWSLEEIALQKKVSSFMRSQNVQDLGGDMWVASTDVNLPKERQERLEDFVKKIAHKGWWVMHWPKEFGGENVQHSTWLAYVEAMAYHGAPVISPGYQADLIMKHGSEWQKSFFLTLIAMGRIIDWSQGYSEPEAGTDLADIKTRAVKDGDYYVINGSKTWNSEGPHAPWGHYLVRTDPNAPKHRGISYLLIDMSSPGITIQPIYDGLGILRWGQVFLEDVRVPRENLIGEENAGFYLAMTSLNRERAQMDVPARRIGTLERFIDYLKGIPTNSNPLDNPAYAHQLADLRVQIETARMLGYRVAFNGESDKGASMLKLINDETTARLYKLLAHALPDYGLLMPEDLRALPERVGSSRWLVGALALAGGSSEAQRLVIAGQRGLNLPR